MSNSEKHNEILKKIEEAKKYSSNKTNKKSLSDIIKNSQDFEQEQLEIMLQKSKKRDSEKSFEDSIAYDTQKKEKIAKQIKKNKPILLNQKAIQINEILEHEDVILTLNNGKVYRTWKPHTATIDKNTLYFGDGREYINGKLSDIIISNCKVSEIYMLESIRTVKQKETEESNFNIILVIFLILLAFMLIAFG